MVELAICFVDAEACGRVALGIGVNQEDGHVVRGERRGEVDGSGGFADATLLVGDGDDFAHVFTEYSSISRALGVCTGESA